MMTGEEFKSIRQSMGLGPPAFARRLGYSGGQGGRMVRRYELMGQVPVRAEQCARALMDGRAGMARRAPRLQCGENVVVAGIPVAGLVRALDDVDAAKQALKDRDAVLTNREG